MLLEAFVPNTGIWTDVQVVLPFWTQVVIPLGSAVVGAIIGGLISWTLAKKQMTKTGRQLFINTALQNEATRSTLPGVLQQIRSKGSSGETVAEKCKDQLWFEYLTSQSPKLQQQILNHIEKEEWDKAINAFRRLLRGED